MTVYKYIDSKNSNKLILDKYYTPKEIVNKCLELFFNTIDINDVSEIIEPSAGNGAFSDELIRYNKPTMFLDIEPEKENITKMDYLDLNLPYLKGRAIIGNPPFGNKLGLALKFYNKSVEISDYIGFILPISQLNNTNSMYKFNLIKSVDLGVANFSDRKVHCCFNIYKRPENKLNKRKQIKLKDITIVRKDSKKYKDISDFDIRMCYWGNSSAGKILNDNENYSGEYKIIIHNKDLKNEIIEALKNVDWKKELNTTAMLRIKQNELITFLKNKIPNIK